MSSVPDQQVGDSLGEHFNIITLHLMTAGGLKPTNTAVIHHLGSILGHCCQTVIPCRYNG
jgi:hypothetical protein